MKNGPIFYTKSGELTPYALSCGYLQRHNGGERWVSLYREHSHYHVMSGKHCEQYDTWETFPTGELTAARKLYKQLKRQAK